MLPLVPQRLAVWSAAGVIATRAMLDAAATSPATVVLLAAVAVLVGAALAGLRFAPAVAARLRRAANVVELVCVLATIPLALAHLGVFSDLLDTF